MVCKIPKTHTCYLTWNSFLLNFLTTALVEFIAVEDYFIPEFVPGFRLVDSTGFHCFFPRPDTYYVCSIVESVRGNGNAAKERENQIKYDFFNAYLVEYQFTVVGLCLADGVGQYLDTVTMMSKIARVLIPLKL